MNDQELSPQHGEPTGSEKKLRKREQRLRDRLQEAQLAQANALERLRRAEARFQKKATRVQRLEGRLGLVDQQLQALNPPPSTVVTLITSVSESSPPQMQEPRLTGKMITPSPETPPLAASVEQIQPVSESIATEQSPVDNRSTTTSTPSIDDGEDAVGASASPLSQPDEEVPSVGQTGEVETEMMSGEAEQQFLERFSNAETASLVEEETDEEISPAPHIDEVVLRAREARAVAEAAEAAARDAIEQMADIEAYLEEVGSTRHLIRELELLEAETNNAIALAQETREAALNAERLVAEAEGSKQDKVEQVKLTPEEEQIITSLPTEEEVATQQVEEEMQAASPSAEAQPEIAFQEEHLSTLNTEEVSTTVTPGVEAEDSEAAQPSQPVSSTYPTQVEIAQAEEIDEEEEVIETVAAMIIADAAAIAAAEAEALAEASSARTREARTTARHADQALASIRLAIRSGSLVGEDAENLLRAAERDATHAHALLADAEAAEERALNTAMNAEAEAEVAEGMAFASGSRNERDEKLREEYSSAHPIAANWTTAIEAEPEDVDLDLDDEKDDDEDNDDDDEDDDDEEDTLEMPVVQPEKS